MTPQNDSNARQSKRELDLVKTLKLEGEGLDVLLIREEPLKKVQEFDIVSPLKWQPKLVTDRGLQFIAQRNKLTSSASKKIDAYLLQDKLKGERARDNVAQFGKYTLHLGRICKAYLTKSGFRVFGFCPAGSTSKVDLTSWLEL